MAEITGEAVLGILTLVSFVGGGIIMMLFAQMNKQRENHAALAKELSDWRYDVAKEYATRTYLDERFDQLEKLIAAQQQHRRKDDTL